MTATAQTAGSRSAFRQWLPLIVIGGALLVVGIVGDTGGQGQALDPNGTGPVGAKALVLLLRQYGADVVLNDGVPTAATQSAVILTDQLDQGRRSALVDWVRAGGRLVVADPTSRLQVGAATFADDPKPAGPCRLPGLERVSLLDVGPSLFLGIPPGGGTGCFGDNSTGDYWFLVAKQVGSGTVIGLGGAGVWTNQRLDHNDNAALAVSLLAPNAGDRVAVLIQSRPGSGSSSAYHLLSPRVRSGLLELLVAFALLAWVRGRRLGRPVLESQPVQLAGSEIVTAVGELLQRTRNREAAASQLRRGLTRWLGERTGLGPHPPPEVLADATSSRSGLDRDHLMRLLTDAPVENEEELVRLAQSLAEVRREVTHGSVQ